MSSRESKDASILTTLLATYGPEIRTAKKKEKAKQDAVQKERALSAAETKRERRRLNRLKRSVGV